MMRSIVAVSRRRLLPTALTLLALIILVPVGDGPVVRRRVALVASESRGVRDSSSRMTHAYRGILPPPTTSPTPAATSTPTATAIPLAPTATVSPSPKPTDTALPTPGPQTQLRVPIFMYHYIRVNPNPADKIGFGLSVPPADFAAHLDLLASRGYQTVALEEVAGFLMGKRPAPPPRSVVLSFDDGYADAYEAAYPLLKKHGFRATIFMITGLVGRPGYLSWPQLKELAANGITIGAHTVSHPDLTAISKTEVTRELVDSKAALEREIGRPVLYFSYPSGKYDDQVVAAVDAAGYQAAVTVRYGLQHRPTDLLKLARVRISGGQSPASIAASAELNRP